MHTTLNLCTGSAKFKPDGARLDTILEGLNVPHTNVLKRVLHASV